MDDLSKLKVQSNIKEVNDRDIKLSKRSSITLSVDNLPSGGITYPKGSKITYYPYNIGELKAYKQSRFTDLEYIDFILNNIYTEFNKYDITYSDFLYISNLLKLSVLGESEVVLTYTCPECKGRNKVTVDLSKLEFIDLDIPELPVVVTVDNNEYYFYPLTIGNKREMILNNIDDEIHELAYMLDIEDKIEAIEIIENVFTGVNAQKLDTINKLLYHDVNDIDHDCTWYIHKDTGELKQFNDVFIESNREDELKEFKKCGSKVAIPFRVISEYIDTEYFTRELILSSIRFGI